MEVITCREYNRRGFNAYKKACDDYEPNSGLATALYFVNDNDGVTIFNRKKTIKSKENRIILFDGSNKHHPTTPTNVNWRSTINIDYIKKPGGERVWVHREHEYV